jgi:hypothetical protein
MRLTSRARARVNLGRFVRTGIALAAGAPADRSISCFNGLVAIALLRVIDYKGL